MPTTRLNLPQQFGRFLLLALRLHCVLLGPLIDSPLKPGHTPRDSRRPHHREGFDAPAFCSLASGL